jgi:hypothetical protein
MSSRVAHHIDFPDYTVDELVAIARSMLDAQAYELSPDALVAFRRYLERRVRRPRFAHGRSVRNAIERARLRHADRVYRLAQRGEQPSLQDLMRIEAADILKSRVFEGESDGEADAPAMASATHQ